MRAGTAFYKMREAFAEDEGVGGVHRLILRSTPEFVSLRKSTAVPLLLTVNLGEDSLKGVHLRL